MTKLEDHKWHLATKPLRNINYIYQKQFIRKNLRVSERWAVLQEDTDQKVQKEIEMNKQKSKRQGGIKPLKQEFHHFFLDRKSVV